MYLFFHVHVNVHTYAHIQLQHHIVRTQDRQEFNIIEFCFVIKDHFYKHHKKSPEVDTKEYQVSPISSLILNLSKTLHKKNLSFNARIISEVRFVEIIQHPRA